MRARSARASSAEHRARQRWKAMRRDLRGRQQILLTVLPTREALADPRFAPGVLEMLAVSVPRQGAVSERECAVCCRPWAYARGPVAVAVFHFLRSDHGTVCGVCGDCSRRPDLHQALAAGFGRDLGFEVERCRPVSAKGCC